MGIGAHHLVTDAAGFALVFWACDLPLRLAKFTRIMTSIRYGGIDSGGDAEAGQH
ncbi:MAG: hypothetical protein NZM12_11855 [Steroidobacteraceae bacterium]|nr:hypothetical protein [Steroidobacteraceae bacterium]MDW8258378.1 hypothetical protein [Gammaproteobacteria bacterium]